MTDKHPVDELVDLRVQEALIRERIREIRAHIIGLRDSETFSGMMSDTHFAYVEDFEEDAISVLKIIKLLGGTGLQAVYEKKRRQFVRVARFDGEKTYPKWPPNSYGETR